MAPMAGLVVMVLLENGAQMEEGQSILVLEAMKMEHVVKSPRAGYVDGLQVAPCQQVFDTSVLFTIKVSRVKTEDWIGTFEGHKGGSLELS
ncbi:methylcrotonoyl-CoA carboxylase subunit alpha, mitochondrial isoform X1 [Iris pallida]|uniref:Methylcrotonoyl-CoA carboxylase subunit alpha, mitochondrial isoform X1 n=1 Tax=Iris pallida TaxID=29817 RepID=A0AAX6EGH1_IRIPA|nr:methylcrotonoyl-CoA carboxylase subunit alpha, mitochondrial isoform X1 [Iris pallida]